MRHRSTVILPLLFLGASLLRGEQLPDGSATVKFATTQDLLDDQHVIIPGDIISIRVLEDRRDAEQRRVPENGMIETLHTGKIQAAGTTCRKLAKLIRQKLTDMPAHPLPFTYSGSPTVVVAIDNMRTCGPGLANLTSHSSSAAPAALDSTTKLQPGRIVGIRIVEDRREKLHQIISATGEVQVPYIGLVSAAGQTCAGLAAKVKVELEKSFFRHATVVVTLDCKGIEEMPNGVTIKCFCPPDAVSVVGNVAKAGKYELPPKGGLTVSGFLVWAGGHTSRKPLPKIQIVRKTPLGDKRILVDTEAILIRKSKEHDLFLRPNDMMLVD